MSPKIAGSLNEFCNRWFKGLEIKYLQIIDRHISFFSSRLACKDSKYVYPAAGHVITGNLRIISDSRIRSIIAKGPKYRLVDRKLVEAPQ